MTINQAHRKALDRSAKSVQTFYVVMEEQPDGSLYDVASSFDLDTFYQGISDQHIIAAYEGGQVCQ